MAKCEKIKILLVDDHLIVREGLKSLLQGEENIDIVGEASNCSEALEKVEELAPDIVLMDILMPGRSGIDATYSLSKKAPGCKILILSVLEEMQDVEQAFKFGARGYILKSAGVDSIKDAIKRVADGEIVLPPSISAFLLQNFGQKNGKHALSEREFEVLGLIAKGLSNRDIGESLFITESTVRTYVQRITEKLHLKNRSEAMLYAIRHGITNGGRV
ncbi:MAG: response regulator transcription factor [Dehalococcoidales bacterium]|jgi:DNA-binding NarL/FixJ family response regulator|nr:response regulator transcription factor [Dehalococcoidales bacterium]MDD4794606.1 response regulator transcription factor [Dehalococcoidales bacterium]MDD5498873.1 response regulator transcription factor [Dehalococcoidales bacterium]MDX9802456.1 response regulator transcription factor [Dehalococcoidales bacterium]